MGSSLVREELVRLVVLVEIVKLVRPAVENAYGYLCGVTVQGEQVLLVFSVGGHNLSHLLNDTRVLRAHICHHLDDLGHREQIVDHGLIG